MPKIEYPEGPLEREYLRDAMRRQGRDNVDDIAAAIQRRWHHSPLRSYRLAAELSLEEACKQVNKLLGVFAEEAGYVHHSTLSRFEYWPATPKARRPTASHLAALAQVYRTSPRRLIDAADWTKLPPAERFALAALDSQAETGATTPVAIMGMMEPARPQAGRTSLVPPNPWGGPERTRSGNPTEKDVLMTGEESTRYAGHGGNIDDLTLDQLREETAARARGFANEPRLTLFGGVRLLRDRIFAYLDGGQPIRQRRDLYFLAGATCGMLASVSDDLGYPTAAMSHARAGHVFALEAGDPALTAWLYARQSLFCYWNGQPSKAREYARRGTALNPAGTVGVWLPAAEARACGELRDAEGVRRAARRAAEIRELVQPGGLDEFGGLMAIDQAKQHYYATGAFLGAGDDQAAIEQAAATVEQYQSGRAEDCAYDNIAVAQFQAATAHTRAGDLDAAVEWAQAALHVEPEYRISHVDKAARRLHEQLRATAARSAPLAVETRDRIEDFLSTTPARLELS